ncbi:hypothetical protein BJ944DRAFT_269777 [Cunninghamella echinulata]|nr:hypothetical protein BJ944DRAFT_269777 [Cunninghamella echinulata]
MIDLFDFDFGTQLMNDELHKNAVVVVVVLQIAVIAIGIVELVHVLTIKMKMKKKKSKKKINVLYLCVYHINYVYYFILFSTLLLFQIHTCDNCG